MRTYDDWKTRAPDDSDRTPKRERSESERRPLDERLADLRDPKCWEAWDAFFARIEAKKS